MESQRRYAEHFSHPSQNIMTGCFASRKLKHVGLCKETCLWQSSPMLPPSRTHSHETDPEEDKAESWTQVMHLVA